MKKIHFKATICLLFTLIANSLSAQTTVTLPVLQDASINAFSPTTPAGSAPILESYPWGAGYSRRFLVQFDLSSIPSGSTITSAKVKLTVSQPSGYNRTINAHTVTNSWNETNVTWSNLAGQFGATASASTLAIWPANSIVDWDLTNDVQSMIDGTISNNGWLFMDSNESDWSQQFWFFHSKEGVVSPPVIEVTYSSGLSPLSITPTITDVSCYNGSDGVASVVASGGNMQGYSYNWSPEPSVGQGTNSVSGLLAGVWTVTVTDDVTNTLTESLAITINEPAVISSLSGISNSTCWSCGDGEINVAASGGNGGYEYSIDGGQNWQLSNEFKTLITGEYSVSVKDNKGCISPVLEVVSVGYDVPLLSITPSTTDVSCDSGNDGVASVVVSGGHMQGYSYNWSPEPSAGQGTNSISGLSAGIWTITVTDDINTNLTESLAITIEEPVVISSLSGVNNSTCWSCSDGEINVVASGGNGGYEYSIDGGQNWQLSNEFKTLLTGEYSVSVKDNKGCISSVLEVVSVGYDVPSLTVTSSYTDVSCYNGTDGVASVVVSGGHMQGYSYNWSPEPSVGQGTNSASGLAAGVWTVTVIDDVNNSLTESIIITIEEPTVISFNSQIKVATCGNCEDGEITINATGGTGNYEFSISNGQDWESINVFSSLLPGDYSILVKDENDCVSPTAENINIGFDSILVSLTKINPGCNESNGSISTLVSGGTPPYSYFWSTQSTNSNVDGLSKGTYSLSISDATGESHIEYIELNYDMETVWLESADVDQNSDGTFTSISASGNALVFSENTLEPNMDGSITMDVPFTFTRWIVGFEISESANVHPYVNYGIELAYNQVSVINNGIRYAFLGLLEGPSSIKIERIGNTMNYYFGDFVTPIYTTTNPSISTNNLVVAIDLEEMGTTIPEPILSFGTCEEIVTETIQYVPLAKKMSDKVWLLNTTALNFVFNEPYTVNDEAILDIELFDFNNNLIASKTDFDLEVKGGSNLVNVPCFSDYLSTANQLYYLKVRNSKKEERYLQILTPSVIPSCQ